VVALILIGIISSAIDSAHNSELRNLATETMNDDYTNVYADIVSMEPEYFVYTSYNSSSYDISEVICKCKTVEGKTIWVAVDIWEYPGGSSTSEERNEAQYYSKSNPKRIVGKDAERNILSNPFKRFEDMNMFRHTKTLGVVEVDPTVWKKLTDLEKQWLKKNCDEKLDYYYSKITK